jgi:hypothetical protein
MYRTGKNLRRGQAAILMTMSLVTTLGTLGLVVDFGWAYFRRSAARTAAESAAIAGAVAASNKALDCGTVNVTCQALTNCPANPTNPPVTNIDRACLYAKQNGFRTAANQSVAIAADRQNSPVAGIQPHYWVSATVTEHLPQTFSAAIGHPWATVKVRSTAGVFLRPAGACIYGLAPTGVGVSVNGNVTVESGCGIYVNSSDSASAMSAGGSSTVRASVINVVGGYNPNGGADVQPAPQTGSTITTDPMATKVAPDAAFVSSLPCSPAITQDSVITMPSDGYYRICSGGFTMTSNKSLTIPSGTYILSGGDIDWRNGTLRATGPVTFYLTGSFSSISVNGNIDVQLDAPPSGPLRGLLFFLDRTKTLTNVSFNGGSNMLLNGSLYFPTSDIKYSGGSSAKNEYTALIAQHITFVGNSYFKSDLQGGFNGLGAPVIGFIE